MYFQKNINVNINTIWRNTCHLVVDGGQIIIRDVMCLIIIIIITIIIVVSCKIQTRFSQ